MTTPSSLRSGARPEWMCNCHQARQRIFHTFTNRACPREPARLQGANLLTSLRNWSILLVLLTSPAVCESQPVNTFASPLFKPTPPSTNVRSLDDDPVRSQAWQLEVIGAFFREAWDLNDGREHPLGGAIRFTRNLKPNWSIGFEAAFLQISHNPVSYTHLTLPTNREV